METQRRIRLAGLAILGVLYLVGILGFSIPVTRSLMADWSHITTPLILALTAAFVVWQQPEKDQYFWIFSAIAFAVGMLVEWIGINTGFPFGSYQYVYGLGPKLAGVPIIIGVNWLLLILTSRALAASFGAVDNTVPIITAGFMVFIDFFLEIVAVKMGWWHWYGKPVPMSNYLAWFVVSLILAYAANGLKVRYENRAGRPVYLMLLAFLFFLSRI